MRRKPKLDLLITQNQFQYLNLKNTNLQYLILALKLNIIFVTEESRFLREYLLAQQKNYSLNNET